MDYDIMSDVSNELHNLNLNVMDLCKNYKPKFIHLHEVKYDESHNISLQDIFINIYNMISVYSKDTGSIIHFTAGKLTCTYTVAEDPEAIMRMINEV